MPQTAPTLDDFVRLFTQYGEGVEKVYLTPADDRYELLFERMIRLLVAPSPFTLALPEPFRQTAHRYHAGDPETVRQLADRDTRHFMLSEVHDWVMLNGGLARRRELARD